MRKKLQKVIFVLLLIFLPAQLGRHFWPEWSYVSGVRVDYLSPTLYLTDILVLLLFVLESQKSKVKSQNFKFKFKSLSGYCFIGLLVLLNIYFSLSPAVSAYKWLKVAEFGFLAWFVARNNKFLLNSYKFLLIPVLYESVLAIWQFWKQASIGGFWYFLGERTFNSGTPGIANADINGQLVLRPYGTFSHPNVLAGWFLAVFPFISRKLNAAVLILGLAALFLTLSRFGVTGWLRSEPKSFDLRWDLNQVAMEQWRTSPLLGTGLGTAPLYSEIRNSKFEIRNYILAFQPTHNIYLLALAETGILGVLGILWVLRMAITSRSIPLVIILVLGLFDHYFLTLQQGQLILALVLGLAFARMKEALKRQGGDHDGS